MNTEMCFTPVVAPAPLVLLALPRVLGLLLPEQALAQTPPEWIA
jgi:hypothetical protein